MPQIVPKLPLEPDWDLLRQNKPSLSLEHLNELAELSSEYLQSEAAEYTEESLISNLQTLWELSKQKNGGINKAHEGKIIGMVAALNSKYALGTGKLAADKQNTGKVVHLDIEREDLIKSDTPRKLGLMDKYAARSACRELKKFVSKARNELDKSESADDKTKKIAVEVYNGKCDAAVRLYDEIPKEFEGKIEAMEALVDFILTGFHANTTAYKSGSWDLENAMVFVRVLNQRRDEFEKLNNPETKNAAGRGHTHFGKLAYDVQAHVYSKIDSVMNFISIKPQNAGHLSAFHNAYEIKKLYPYLEECAKMARPSLGTKPYEHDLTGVVQESIRKHLDYMFSDFMAGDKSLIWADMIMKISPEFYLKENIDERLWGVWAREIINHAKYAKFMGDNYLLDATLRNIREKSPQFYERAGHLAAKTLNEKLEITVTAEKIKKALKCLGFDEDADIENISSGQIKKQYRKLAMANHPDRNVEEDEVDRRTERMAELNEAYEILGGIKTPKS